MTYIKDSAVGFVLAICDSMDLEILTVKGEGKVVFAINILNSR